MVFPTLFADTDGDPANHSAIMSISENDLETFAAELLQKKRNGERVYRFPSSSRFG